jgi:protease-4
LVVAGGLVRRLLLIFSLLLLTGAGLAGLGLVLAGRGGGGLVAAGPRVVELVLDAPVEDYAPAPPLRLPGESYQPTLASIWTALSAARRDPTVAGVAVRIVDADFGLAKAAELRRQLEATAAAGKFVACYLETAGEGSNGTLEYFVASACPTVALAPAGEINLLGLRADSLFLRGALDKLRIEPSFLTAGRFKSAAEVFTEREHSPAAREAIDAVLDGYFDQIVDGIARSRRLEPDAVRALVERAPFGAEEALAAGLVDALEFPDQFEARLEQLADGEPTRIALADYARERGGGGRRGGGLGGGRVAIVFARGTIVRGEGGVEPFGGETFLGSDGLGEILRGLTEDDGVAAVVLRVDSPGGSALASDLILRRVELLKQAKPVVVSMSDVAASGGYYVAAKASRILAEPGTLTGSIGVVTGKLATGRFQQEHLGATHDVLQRGGRAGIYSSLEPFDEAERAVVARQVDAIYERFVGHVAAGRSLAPERVRELAQGRVWTGEDALRLGLVDELGGLDAALAAARSAAGLPTGPGPIELHPRPRGLLDWLAGVRPAPAFGAELAPLAELARLARAARAPLSLELPPPIAGLARPF